MKDENNSPATRYCYHCRTHHPVEEMKLLVTKTGSRWRCIKSIEAVKRSKEERDQYGRQVSAANQAEASGRARMLNKIQQER
ncbi:hypothetical protein MASR1M60_12800 [Rhodocyclaceae bacterium]